MDTLSRRPVAAGEGVAVRDSAAALQLLGEGSCSRQPGVCLPGEGGGARSCLLRSCHTLSVRLAALGQERPGAWNHPELSPR